MRIFARRGAAYASNSRDLTACGLCPPRTSLLTVRDSCFRRKLRSALFCGLADCAKSFWGGVGGGGCKGGGAAKAAGCRGFRRAVRARSGAAAQAIYRNEARLSAPIEHALNHAPGVSHDLR